MRALLMLVTAALLLAPTAPLPAGVLSQTPDLSGRWRVDYELSDTLQGDPLTASGDGDPRRRGGAFGGFGAPGTYGRGDFRGGRGASGHPDGERDREDRRARR